MHVSIYGLANGKSLTAYTYLYHQIKMAAGQGWTSVPRFLFSIRPLMARMAELNKTAPPHATLAGKSLAVHISRHLYRQSMARPPVSGLVEKPGHKIKQTLKPRENKILNLWETHVVRPVTSTHTS
jgi:hypothetical protein